VFGGPKETQKDQGARITCSEVLACGEMGGFIKCCFSVLGPYYAHLVPIVIMLILVGVTKDDDLMAAFGSC
jgi:hypothetical protein